jgi:hypothetical protein
LIAWPVCRYKDRFARADAEAPAINSLGIAYLAGCGLPSPLIAEGVKLMVRARALGNLSARAGLTSHDILKFIDAAGVAKLQTALAERQFFKGSIDANDRPHFFHFFRWRTLPELLWRKQQGGLPLVLAQTFRAIIHSRMKVGMEKYRRQYPHADILLFEPGREDGGSGSSTPGVPELSKGRAVARGELVPEEGQLRPQRLPVRMTLERVSATQVGTRANRPAAATAQPLARCGQSRSHTSATSHHATLTSINSVNAAASTSQTRAAIASSATSSTNPRRAACGAVLRNADHSHAPAAMNNATSARDSHIGPSSNTPSSTAASARAVMMRVRIRRPAARP